MHTTVSSLYRQCRVPSHGVYQMHASARAIVYLIERYGPVRYARHRVLVRERLAQAAGWTTM
jgi:hypothetical protein